MKISELVVGNMARIDLVVKTSEIKLTKNQKPYLSMELMDGFESIQAINWDWTSPETPARNAILSVVAQVTEYAGKKQLNVKQQAINTDLGLELFAPKGDMDIAEYVVKASDLIDSITNDVMRQLVRTIFNDNGSLWRTAPAAKGVHHAYVAGNLKHAVDTATKAKAIGALIPQCNLDLCVAGALLHDLGKLQGYCLDGVIVDMTEEGSLLEHIAIGIAMLEKYRTPTNAGLIMLLQHIIASHHEKLEWGSPATPRFIEAWVVAYSDNIDAKTQTLVEANAKLPAEATQTDKIWSMDNRQMLTQTYVSRLVNEAV